MSAESIGHNRDYNKDAFQRAFRVSDAQMRKLETYAALLQKWQKAVNLVSSESISDIWKRHFADSAQLVSFLGPARTLLDFGSGAGFPGLVIALLISDWPGCRVHLVESNARKCAFLREVARQTGTTVEIHNARIEEIAAQGTLLNVDAVTARGVAPLARLLALSKPFFQQDSIGLFLKGRRGQDEVVDARKAWKFDLQCHLSATDPHGQILKIENLERVEG